MSIVDFPVAGTVGASMKPQRFDFEVYQGDTFQFDLILKAGDVPVDLTGWTVKAQIKNYGDNTLAATPALDTTIAADPTLGKIVIKLSDTGTSALAPTAIATDGMAVGEYKYDVQATDSYGNVRTFIGGKITVTEDVTE